MRLDLVLTGAALVAGRVCTLGRNTVLLSLLSLPDHRYVRCRLRGDTIQVVKAYRIQRVKGGMKFNCTQCSHSVSTMDFDPRIGNLRTQAATAINGHATQAHHAPMMVSPSDSQQRSWR
jgi:hypothetical protein